MTDKHEADLQRVNAENTYTDITRAGEHLPQGGGLFTTMVNGLVRTVAETNPNKKAVWGSTDFDGKDLALNQMLDLVEGTDPEDLESSGKALWDARDAIKEAADELNGHIDKVRWVGKSGNDFRTWGTNLVASTTELSKFAGDAGDQLATAAVGLASVRGSMPSRDTEANRKRPEHFTEAEKTANKDEYTAAVRVEKDRQEAINQMNRLASYYAVSGQELESLQAPTFKSMPSVGVPRPEQQRWNSSGSDSSEGTGTTTPATHHSVASTSRTDIHDVSNTPTPAKDFAGRITRPDDVVGTNIDSVNTLPPPTTAPTGHTPTVTGVPPMGGGQTPAPEGLGSPVPNGMSGRNLNGTGGLRTPTSAQGRAGSPGLTNSGSGRSTGQGVTSQMGRATSTGQSAAKGLTSGSNSSQMGRGISGGTPRAGGTVTPRASSGPATGAGRANGVVGGRPAAGDASAKGGSRIPRGTVVGGEGAASSRPATGRPGQGGVFGAAPESTARPGSKATAPRGSAGAPEAVTGRAAARNSAAGAERNGMTRGGAGLVRGPAQNGKPGDERNAQGSTRPDYLVEDEETHLPDKPRRDVPPVVN
ncbi:hypothetical protein ABZ027_12560 [Streptomyces sp. NPDC006332]|uniref:hypothetical protein n=1 Tax=Streptomyces sp. NPDC006332 TaxID=3155456 RepID=UPI0033AF4393